MVITNTDTRLFPKILSVIGYLGVTLVHNWNEYLHLNSETEQASSNAPDIPFIGQHNHWNVAAAALLCHAIGIPFAELDVTGLQPLEHRLEPIRNLNGVHWVNDSKTANVEATEAALNGVKRTAIVLLGGVGKDGADYTCLCSPIEKARHVICFGQSGSDIVNEITAHPNRHLVNPLTQRQLAHQLSVSSDTVLLSPACASFDEFDNFMHRGQTFRDFALRWRPHE